MAAAYAPEMREQAVALSATLSHRKIASQLGVSRAAVARWVNPEARQRQCERSRSRRAARQPRPRRSRKKEDLVPLGRLADAVLEAEAGGLLRAEICERMGWAQHDTTSLARALGLMDTKPGKRNTQIDEPTALLVLKAIHLDPFDVGI